MQTFCSTNPWLEENNISNSNNNNKWKLANSVCQSIAISLVTFCATQKTIHL